VSFGRFSAYLGLAWAALLITATARSLMPLAPSQAVPNVALLLVLHVGLGGRGSLSTSVGLGMAIGYLCDLFSGAPRGLYALSLGAVMVLARGASSRLMVASLWQQLVVTLLATLGHGAMITALSSPMYSGDALQALRLLPPTAFSTALIAPFVFAGLTRLDRRLQPDTGKLRAS
jgi:rod shape-determining protein MreD